MAQLGVNAHGEVLVPGRVPDCYLGLLLDPPGDQQPGRVLVVAPAALRHPGIPQPDGTVLYELVTGHPNRVPQELVFVADLTVELRAWPTDTWAKVGVDPQAAAGALVAGWQRSDLLGRCSRLALADRAGVRIRERHQPISDHPVAGQPLRGLRQQPLGRTDRLLQLTDPPTQPPVTGSAGQRPAGVARHHLHLRRVHRATWRLRR